MRTFDELGGGERRRQAGELDHVGEQQRDVVEAVGDEGLPVAQALGDRRGQDVEQEALVLAGEPLPFPHRRHVRAVDVDEAELGDVDRQERIGPLAGLDLEGIRVRGAGAGQQRIAKIGRQRGPGRETQARGEAGARRVGVDEAAVPVDPEDRVRVLVRELDDRPLGRDVRAVQVHEAQVLDEDRPDRIGPVVRAELEGLPHGGGLPAPGEDLLRHALADAGSDRPQHARARRVRIDEVTVEIDAHHRVRIVIREPVDRAELRAAQDGVSPMGVIG